MTLARKNNRTSLRNITASERRALFERARDINRLRTATELMGLTCEATRTSLSFNVVDHDHGRLVLALPNGDGLSSQLHGSIDFDLVSPDFHVLAQVFAGEVFPERQQVVRPVVNQRPTVARYSATMTFDADQAVNLVTVIEDARTIGCAFDVALRQHPALHALALLSTLSDTSEGVENLRRTSACHPIDGLAHSLSEIAGLRSRALTFLRSDPTLVSGMELVESHDLGSTDPYPAARILLMDVADAIRRK